MQGAAGVETVRQDTGDETVMAPRRESVQRSPADNRNKVVTPTCAKETSTRSVESGSSEVKHDRSARWQQPSNRLSRAA